MRRSARPFGRHPQQTPGHQLEERMRHPAVTATAGCRALVGDSRLAARYASTRTWVWI